MNELDRQDAEASTLSQPAERKGPGRATRIALGLLAVVIVAAIGAAAVYTYARWSRSQPPDVARYPGAQEVAAEMLAVGRDRRQYAVVAAVAEVEAFYEGQDDMACSRQFAAQEDGAGGEGAGRHVATHCLLDRSLLGFTQYATVVIRPTYDPAQEPSGEVVIDVQRYWDR